MLEPTPENATLLFTANTVLLAITLGVIRGIGPRIQTGIRATNVTIQHRAKVGGLSIASLFVSAGLGVVALINILGLMLGFSAGPFTDENFDFARSCSYFSVVFFTTGMLTAGTIYADQWVSFWRRKPSWFDIDTES